MVTGAAAEDSVRSLFGGLIPAEVIDAYDRLRATNGYAKDQAEALVGDAGLVAALTNRGMAHIQPHSPHRSGVAASRSTRPRLAGRAGRAPEPVGPGSGTFCWLGTIAWPTPKHGTAQA